MKGSILFVCNYREPLRSTVLPLCRALSQYDGLDSRVFLESDSAGVMSRMCAEVRVDFQCGGSQRMHSGSTSNRKKRGNRKLGAVRWLLRTVGNTLSLRLKISRSRRLLGGLRPDVVVLMDDRTIFASRWIRAAELSAIPVVAIQWAAWLDQESMAAVRSVAQPGHAKSRLLRVVERIVAAAVPRAVTERDGRTVWWLSSDLVVSYWLNRAFPRRNPWVFGGGNSDQVAVMGPVWQERIAKGLAPTGAHPMVRGGTEVPENGGSQGNAVSSAATFGGRPERIRLTGHPEQDVWFRMRNDWSAEKTDEVLRQLNIPAKSKIVTVISPALCFRAEGGNRSGDCSLAELREHLSSAVNVIRALGEPYVPVVKVHPRDCVDDFSFLSRQGVPAPCVVRDFSIERLLAASSVMLCQWSTTAMISQAVGTPVVIFDFNESPSGNLWKRERALPRATDVASLDEQLQKCLSDPQARRELAARRDDFVRRYLCLDGNATQRLVDLILETAKLSAVPDRQPAAA